MESLSDRIRSHINSKLDSDINFYSSTKIRNSDMAEFIEKSNSSLPEGKKLEKNKIRPSWNKILTQVMKNRNLDTSIFDKKNPTVKFNRDMNAKIETVNQEIKDDKKPKQGAPIVASGQPQPVALEPEHFDEESAAAICNGFYTFGQVAFPELDSLTPEQQKSLGKLWKAIFNRYLVSDKTEIVIACMATAGILAPKIQDARKKREKKKLNEIVPDTPKTAEEQRNQTTKEEPKEPVQEVPKPEIVSPKSPKSFEENTLLSRPSVNPVKPIEDKKNE